MFGFWFAIWFLVDGTPLTGHRQQFIWVAMFQFAIALPLIFFFILLNQFVGVYWKGQTIISLKFSEEEKKVIYNKFLCVLFCSDEECKSRRIILLELISSERKRKKKVFYSACTQTQSPLLLLCGEKSDDEICLKEREKIKALAVSQSFHFTSLHFLSNEHNTQI